MQGGQIKTPPLCRPNSGTQRDMSATTAAPYIDDLDATDRRVTAANSYSPHLSSQQDGSIAVRLQSEVFMWFLCFRRLIAGFLLLLPRIERD